MASNKVLQAVVEIAGSISPTLQSAVEGAADKLDKVNLKAAAIGAAAAAGAVAIGKAAIEAGKYLVDLGSQFDEVTDAIRIGTGATGDALDSLMEDFDAVYSSVPTTMEDASKAIADYNTRLGLTGEALQGISVQAIQVADMLGEDLGTVIESSSKAFQQWNIDADNMGDAMDYVFKASQSTGVGFSELMSSVQQYGAQMQEMGYSFEEATALIGQLEKAGVNTNEVLSAMKKSVGALADEGIGAAEGLEMYVDAITNAKDMTQATAIAAEVFGSKAASTMAAAIRDGTVDVAALTAELQANGETINGCAEDTYDFAERLQLFKQKAQVALEPLASTMFDSLNELMPVVGNLMESLIPIIQNLTTTLTPLITDLVAKLGPLLEELVPVIVDVAGSVASELIPPIVEIITSIIPVLVKLLKMVAPILTTLIKSVLPVIVQLVNKLIPPILKIVESVLPILEDLLSAVLPLLDQLIAAVLPIVIQLIESLLPLVMTIVESVLPIVVDLLNKVVPILTQILSKILPVIVKLIEALVPILTKIVEAVLPILVEVLNLLTPILDLVIALLEPILDLFLMILEPILNLISSALDPFIEILSELIQFALEPLMPLIQIIADLFDGVLGAAIDAIMPVIDALQNTLGALINFVTSVFKGDWDGAWSAMQDYFASIWEGLKAIVKAPIEFIRNIVYDLGTAISSIFSLAWDRVRKVWGAVSSWFNKNIIQPVAGFFKGLWQNVAGFFGNLWDDITGVFKSAASWFDTNVVQPIVGFFRGIWESVSGFFTNLWNDIVTAYHTVIDPWIEIVKRIASIIHDTVIVPVKEFFQGLWDGIVGIFTPIASWFTEKFTAAVEGIKAAWAAVAGFFSGIWEGIKGAFSSVGSWFSSVFTEAYAKITAAFSGIKNFFAGIWDGIKGAFSAVTSWFSSTFTAAWTAVKNVFSTGGKIFDGIKDGILSGFKTVVNGIIGGINKVIKVPFDGINSVLSKIKGISIVGVKPFDWISTLNVPQIPTLATGGFTEGVSIAGEAGTEAVISFDPRYHEENVKTWAKAGKLLGVLSDLNVGTGTEVATAASLQLIRDEESTQEAPLITQAGRLIELDDFSLGMLTETTIIYYDFSGFTWAPQVEAGEKADRDDIMAALRDNENEFFDWLEEWLRQKEVGSFDRVSIY